MNQIMKNEPETISIDYDRKDLLYWAFIEACRQIAVTNRD